MEKKKWKKFLKQWQSVDVKYQLTGQESSEKISRTNEKLNLGISF